MLQQELVKVARAVAAGEDEKGAMKEQIKSLRDLIGNASESTAEVKQLEQQLAESIGKFTDVRGCLFAVMKVRVLRERQLQCKYNAVCLELNEVKQSTAAEAERMREHIQELKSAISGKEDEIEQAKSQFRSCEKMLKGAKEAYHDIQVELEKSELQRCVTAFGSKMAFGANRWSLA